MRNKISYSAAESAVIKKVFSIYDLIGSDVYLDIIASNENYRAPKPDAPAGLSFESVLQVCADVWEVDKESLLQPFNQKDQRDYHRKISVLWLANFFCNDAPWTVSKLAGKSGKTYQQTHQMRWGLRTGGCWYSQHAINLFMHCLELLPSRLDDLLKFHVPKPKPKPQPQVNVTLANYYRELENSNRMYLDAYLKTIDINTLLTKQIIELQKKLVSKGIPLHSITDNDRCSPHSRDDLPGRSREEIITYYQNDDDDTLQEELDYWQNIEMYEICAVIRHLLDNTTLQ